MCCCHFFPFPLFWLNAIKFWLQQRLSRPGMFCIFWIAFVIPWNSVFCLIKVGVKCHGWMDRCQALLIWILTCMLVANFHKSSSLQTHCAVVHDSKLEKDSGGQMAEPPFWSFLPSKPFCDCVILRRHRHLIHQHRQQPTHTCHTCPVQFSSSIRSINQHSTGIDSSAAIQLLLAIHYSTERNALHCTCCNGWWMRIIISY